jgi:hypothetical protein
MTICEEFMLWKGPDLLSTNLAQARPVGSPAKVTCDCLLVWARFLEQLQVRCLHLWILRCRPAWGIRRVINKNECQSHELPDHPAKVARYPPFNRACQPFRVLRSESLIIFIRSSLEGSKRRIEHTHPTRLHPKTLHTHKHSSICGSGRRTPTPVDTSRVPF